MIQFYLPLLKTSARNLVPVRARGLSIEPKSSGRYFFGGYNTMEEITLSMIVGLLALTCIGLMALHFRMKMKKLRKQYRSRLPKIDIGVLKVCYDGLRMLWERNKPDRNVLFIEDYIEEHNLREDR